MSMCPRGCGLKRFPYLTLAGEGELPKTFLSRGITGFWQSMPSKPLKCGPKECEVLVL